MKIIYKLDLILEKILRFKLPIMAGIILYMLTGSYLTLRYWYLLTMYPGEIDYAEPIMLYESQLILHGQNIYPLADDNYFTAANHGPLFYIANALANNFLPNHYLPGRILSLLGVLFIIASFLYAVHTQGGGVFALCIAFCMSIFPYSVIRYGPVCKPDSLYIGLTLLGLVMAQKHLKSGKVLYSIPFFVLALFFKPVALAAPAAVFVALLLKKSRRAVIFIVSGFVLSSILLLLIATFMEPIGMLTHIFRFNVAKYNIHAALLSNPIGFFFFFYSIIILAVIMYFLFVRKTVYALYFIIAFILHVIVLGGKVGAWANYWSEPTLALTLCIALGIGNYLKDGNRQSIRIQALVLLMIIVFCALNNPRSGKVPPTREDYANDAAVQNIVCELAGSGRPLVFVSNPAVAARQDCVRMPISDPFLYTQHVLLGVNNGKLLEGLIKTKRFAFIALTTQSNFTDGLFKERIPEHYFSMVLKYYKFKKKFRGTRYSEGDIYFFVPK